MGTAEKTPRRPNPDPPQQSPSPGRVALRARRVAAWVLLAATLCFALVSILAIWGVFEDDGGTTVWRAFASLAVVMVTAGIVVFVTNLIDRN